MADTKHRSAVDRFMGGGLPQYEPEVEEAAVRGVFGEVRKTRQRGRESISLDVRLADGQRHGFNYAYLVRKHFIPGDAIEVEFAGTVVTITGRRLEDLYERLLDHRVDAIQEGTETEEGLKPADAAHIDGIKISNREDEQHE